MNPRHALAVALAGLAVAGCDVDYDTPPPATTTTVATTTTTADDGVTTTLPAMAAGGVLLTDGPIQASTVTKVWDGDTFDLADGRRVRLIGINAPETRFKQECGGKEATAALKAILPIGARVVLTPDVTDKDDQTYKNAITGVEVKGRLLRYVDVDGVDIGGVLVLNGHAASKRYPPDTALSATYDEMQARAQAASSGMWGACPR